jgi:hypothetical protein
VTAKTIPRHARTVGRQRWVPGPRAGRPAGGRAPCISQPGPAGGRVRADPLAGPVAITERAVLGDRIRRPTAWCEMAACISRYEDPAALGEADIRARALAAGWRHDAVGRLVCRYCQQRNPALWPACPLAPHEDTAARGPGRDTGHARAGRISAVWSVLSAWCQGLWSSQDRGRWPRLLAALAAGRNGWNTPPPGPATGVPGRRAGAGQQVPAVPGTVDDRRRRARDRPSLAEHVHKHACGTAQRGDVFG